MTHALVGLRKCVSAAALTAVLLLASAASAQNSSKLSGTILDVQGKAVANATVVVRNTAGGVSRTVRTDASGNYVVDGLAAGKYEIEASANGFATGYKNAVQLTSGQPQQASLTLTVSTVTQMVEVNAGVDSVAAQQAPSGGFIEERSAQSLISDNYIHNFTVPTADYGEIVQIVPGTFTLNGNGPGLGQSKTYFRGFPDGDYDIDFDGVPFYDTNSPTHHSWAFFPNQWVGGVDFDRSPGSAATIGPTPFGGSIHLQSMPLSNELDLRGNFNYGSWNTKLFDGAFNSGSFGLFGGPARSNLFVDVHRMSSDGYQTYNIQMRNAGSVLYQYAFSPRTLLTGFSGVLRVNANTPNFNPTRCQTLGAGSTYTCTGASSGFVGQGKQFYLTNNADPVNWLDYQYNTYQVPTDFEYVGLKSELGKGWTLDIKPYTYNYDNGERYSNATPITEATTVNGSKTYNGVAIAPCNIAVVKKGVTALPCGVNKYNSYRKYGETSSITQSSKLGIARFGVWYEWAKTNRSQYPADPVNGWTQQALPNFWERFWTNSYQPYAEYELHLTKQLNVTAGVKYAGYSMDLTQYNDDGKTVGTLCPLGQTTNCPTHVNNHAWYGAWLPSIDANYRIRSNWSVYAQAAKGSAVPPSNVFDYNQTPSASIPKPQLSNRPKQQLNTTYQAGTVVKLNHVTFDADYYHIYFQNGYSSQQDTTAGDPQYGETIYFLQPSSVSQGFEAESNVAFLHGFSAYANVTVGRATYTGELNAGTIAKPFNQKAPSGLWVAQTPTDTEAEGLTYQTKRFDIGAYNKRIGTQRIDNGSYHNQATIDPFQTTNTYFNYTVRGGSIFDQSKIRFSVNNLFNQKNLTNVGLTGTAQTMTLANGDKDLFNTNGPTPIAGADTMSFLSGRSITISFTFGLAPRR